MREPSTGYGQLRTVVRIRTGRDRILSWFGPPRSGVEGLHEGLAFDVNTAYIRAVGFARL